MYYYGKSQHNVKRGKSEEDRMAENKTMTKTITSM